MAKEKREGPTDQQWGHAMSLWVTTDMSAIRIGEEIGVSEGAVRKRAKRDAWGPRNAPERKRALVAAAASGTNLGTSLVPRTAAEKAILEAAQVDIEDMDLALRVGQKLLRRCAQLLDMGGDDAPFLDPKSLSNVASTWKMTVEGIRKIRGLDEPGDKAGAEVLIEWGDVVGRR